MKNAPFYGGCKVGLWWASDNPAVSREMPTLLLILRWSTIYSDHFLSLDGANHDALDEVFLEHRVDEEDRDGGHHHRGILDAFADRGGGIRRQTGGHGAYAVGDQDLTQHQLQRVLGTGAQIEHGVEPGVPVTDGVEQHHDGQRRLRKRKDDAEEDLEVVGAVDPCRFLHAVGDLAHAVSHDDQVPRVYSVGKHHGPEVVVQADALDHQEGGDHAAAKEHGEGDQEHDGVTGAEAFPGQNIRAKASQQQIDAGTNRHIQQRLIVVFDHLLGFVGRHFVLADDARSISFRRKGSFDHAGPNSLVDGRFFHDLFGQLVEHKAAPGNFGNHIALRFDGLVDDKPEGLSVLSLKRQENCRFFSGFLHRRPELADGYRHGQPIGDFFTGQIPIHKLLNKRLHATTSLLIIYYSISIILPIKSKCKRDIFDSMARP